MQFNAAAFKAGWREACRQRQIDPVEGATSFQVAAYKAELDEERRRRQPKRWMTPNGQWILYQFQLENHDRTEVAVLGRLIDRKQLRLDQGFVSSEDVDVPAFCELWQEVKQEMRRDIVHKVSLRDLQRLPRAAVVIAV